MTNAYEYLMEAGGLEEERSYPYTGKRGHCKFDPEKVAVRVVNFTTIPLDEDQIAANLVRQGPLAGEIYQLICVLFVAKINFFCVQSPNI